MVADVTVTPAPGLRTSSTVAVVETVVPFALTKGRTNIAVMLRAHERVTPPLRELRVMQDHNEQVDEYVDLNARIRLPHTPQSIR